ncbi:MAG: CvpA family protein [Candidatus Fimivivens sp.]
MAWVLDAITVGIIAAFGFSSYRQGFLNTIVMLLGSLGAVFVAFTYSEPIAQIIYQQFLNEKVLTVVSENLQSLTAIDAAAFARELEEMVREMPALFSFAFEADMGNWYQQLTAGNDAAVSAAITDTIIAPVAISLLRVVIFFILFSLLMILVKVVAGLLKTVNHLPIIGIFNGLLGGVLGVIQGMLYMFVISAVLWFLFSISNGEIGAISAQTIEQTIFLKHFYTAGPWVESTIQLI